MLRERNIQTAAFSAGQSQVLDLPRDAIYHIIQTQFSGTFTNTQGAGGTGVVLDDAFPFSLLKNIRLIRNGSDVVFQGSGPMLAAEHYYLNETWPHARLYTSAANVETLLLSSAALALGGKGVVIPANDEGIGIRQVQFATPSAPNTTVTVNFDFQLDLYLQLGPADIYYGSLVDARRLAAYQLVFDYANIVDVSIPGVTNTNTIAATGRIMSYDQDNVDVNVDFGTFKRSTLSITNLTYGSANQQVLLPRGNYFHGVILDTLAQKAGSATVLAHENAVISAINNRINSNFTLRNVNWEDLQRKNQADGCANSAFSGSRGIPNGMAYLYYPATGDRGSELVPTHVFDQFDFQLSLNALAAAENGVTTAATNPTINMLLEEVIPGVSLGESYPTAAQAGSKRATSAKPYAR